MIVSQLMEEAVLQLQWELIHLDPTLVVQTKVDEQLLCKTPGEEKLMLSNEMNFQSNILTTLWYTTGSVL